MCAWLVGLSTIGSIVISFLLPKVYQSEVVLLPLGGSRGNYSSSILSAVSDLPFVGGLTQNLGGGGQLPVLLRSWSMAERVIQRLDLIPLLYGKQWRAVQGTVGEVGVRDQVIEQVRSMIHVSEDVKSGKLVLTCEYENPQLAAKIAETFVELLQDFINENTFSLAKRNRRFIEKQLAMNRKEFLESGKALNTFYKDRRISSVESTVDVTIERADESEAVERNFDPIKLGTQLATIEQKKNAVQQFLSDAEVVRGIPQQVYLQYLTIQRELLGKMTALLTQQYELARIDEAKDELSFQVVDPARVPVRAIRPKRRVIVLSAFVSAFVASIGLAFIVEYFSRHRSRSGSAV
ncbi:MAG: hypothetical protein HY696_09530 [Deltaproteobacteria bacterium]|nr:hypothetical protein [Deltaproteobacteria bacterium]